MGRFESSHFKWQIFEISIGLICLACGIVLFLKLDGTSYLIWSILSGTLACIGAGCTIIGITWCIWTIRRTRVDHDLYGRVKECEEENLTVSEAAEHER